MALRLSTTRCAPPAALNPSLATPQLRRCPVATAAAAADNAAPSSSSDGIAKGFAAGATKTTDKRAAKKAGPPPAKAGKKVRSAGRGALARTEQGAKIAKNAAAAGATATPSGPGEWVRLAELSEWRPTKAGKAVTLPDGTVLCLFKAVGAGGSVRVYATEIYSTAFKYPLVDADVSAGPPATVTVPFDGSVYNLTDGSVVSWCPGNTPVRALLGAVKSRVEPAPIRVYPARVGGDGKSVEVWFAR